MRSTKTLIRLRACASLFEISLGVHVRRYVLSHCGSFCCFYILSFSIVLEFNGTSTLVSSPREREKRDRRDSSGDERERQGRKRNRNESEKKTEEIPHLPLPATRIAGLAKL